MDGDDFREAEPFERFVTDGATGLGRVAAPPDRPPEHPSDFDLLGRNLLAAVAEVLRLGEAEARAGVLDDDPPSAEAVVAVTRERRLEISLRDVARERAARTPVAHGLWIGRERDELLQAGRLQGLEEEALGLDHVH